jgi:hypothetical protein
MALKNRTQPCTIEQCCHHQVARGLCNTHYKKRDQLGLARYRYANLADCGAAEQTRKSHNEWDDVLV